MILIETKKNCTPGLYWFADDRDELLMKLTKEVDYLAELKSVIEELNSMELPFESGITPFENGYYLIVK